MNEIPNELLVQFFSYHTPQTLIHSAPYVNHTWAHSFLSTFPAAKALMNHSQAKHKLFGLHLLTYLSNRCTTTTLQSEFSDMLFPQLEAYCNIQSTQHLQQFLHQTGMLHMLVAGPERSGRTTLCHTIRNEKPSLHCRGLVFSAIKLVRPIGTNTTIALKINRFQALSVSDLVESLAGVAVICFNIAQRTSYEEALNMIHEIQRDESSEIVDFILVGTMKDLQSSRQVSEMEASHKALELAVPYVEVSSSNYENITLLYFWALSMTILQRYKRPIPTDSEHRFNKN